jgi:hypothetical protein
MSRTTRQKLLALSIFAAAVASLCWARRASAPSEASADPGLVDGRLWVESRPEKLTDYVQAAVFVTPANFGVFQRASSYDMHLEFFDMTRDAKSIRLTFPQTNRSATLRFAVRECRDKRPFDLCLDLSNNPWGGPLRYYGFSQPDEERRVLGPLDAIVRAHLR